MLVAFEGLANLNGLYISYAVLTSPYSFYTAVSNSWEIISKIINEKVNWRRSEGISALITDAKII
jgi:hypothetical protein